MAPFSFTQIQLCGGKTSILGSLHRAGYRFLSFMDTQDVATTIKALSDLALPPVQFHSSLLHVIVRHAACMTSSDLLTSVEAIHSLNLASQDRMIALHMWKLFLPRLNVELQSWRETKCPSAHHQHVLTAFRVLDVTHRTGTPSHLHYGIWHYTDLSFRNAEFTFVRGVQLSVLVEWLESFTVAATTWDKGQRALCLSTKTSLPPYLFCLVCHSLVAALREKYPPQSIPSDLLSRLVTAVLQTAAISPPSSNLDTTYALPLLADLVFELVAGARNSFLFEAANANEHPRVDAQVCAAKLLRVSIELAPYLPTSSPYHSGKLPHINLLMQLQQLCLSDPRITSAVLQLPFASQKSCECIVSVVVANSHALKNFLLHSQGDCDLRSLIQISMVVIRASVAQPFMPASIDALKAVLHWWEQCPVSTIRSSSVMCCDHMWNVKHHLTSISARWNCLLWSCVDAKKQLPASDQDSIPRSLVDSILHAVVGACVSLHTPVALSEASIWAKCQLVSFLVAQDSTSTSMALHRAHVMSSLSLVDIPPQLTIWIVRGVVNNPRYSNETQAAILVELMHLDSFLSGMVAHFNSFHVSEAVAIVAVCADSIHQLLLKSPHKQILSSLLFVAQMYASVHGGQPSSAPLIFASENSSSFKSELFTTLRSLADDGVPVSETDAIGEDLFLEDLNFHEQEADKVVIRDEFFLTAEEEFRFQQGLLILKVLLDTQTDSSPERTIP